MLAETSEPFSGQGWIFELKYDGFRMLAGTRDGVPRLRYRRGADATVAFPEIAEAVAAVGASDLILDGELVVLDAQGRPSFQRLQQRYQGRPRDARGAVARQPATLFVFDMLGLADRDLRPLPLIDRKAMLAEVLVSAMTRTGGRLRYVEHIADAGERFFDEVRAQGLEGVVAKRAGSPYVPGRSADWRKFRVDRCADFVVVGFTAAGVGEEGGLHLAAWRSGQLVYAGRVGSGFEAGVLARARALLHPLRRPRPACAGAVPRGRGHAWVEPRLVCAVRFKEVTEAHLLRQPVFVRFQPDRSPEDCR